MQNKKRLIICIVALFVVIVGCVQARNAYIKAKKTSAGEALTTQKEDKQTVKKGWVKEEDKSYYYGEDGKALTGRFVLKEEKKICYADENGVITRIVDGTKPMISITYDDGPSQFSDDFAALFDKYDSAATFFEVGERVKEMPSLDRHMKAIADSNSELANHTYSHKNVAKLSTEGMLKQIGKNEKLLRSYGEKAEPILFRAPEGAVNSNVRENCGVPIILWSVDTLDWKSRDADSVYKIAKKSTDGDIILMHSLYESSLKASEKLVPELIEKGFQLVTVTDLAEFRGGFNNGEKYFSFPPLEEETATEATSEEK